MANVNVFDDIRDKLEADQIEDKEELINDLLATLDAIYSRTNQGRFTTDDELDSDIDTYLQKYKGEVLTCGWETYRATLETPAEYCENNAMAGSDYCYMHD